MNINNFKNIYFLGIGGIGMSALAQYFLHKGQKVYGYDRTPSAMTKKLSDLGATVSYDESTAALPEDIINNPEQSLVVYTPAIPEEHAAFQYFKKNDYAVFKRAEILGFLSKAFFTIAVAGTHGKTSTAGLVSYLLHRHDIKHYAFLGGISAAYDSNFLAPASSAPAGIAVIEADEFDRSFLKLSVDIGIITGVEADHLEVYDNEEGVRAAFQAFAQKVKPDGLLILQEQVKDLFTEQQHCEKQTYGFEADNHYQAEKIKHHEWGTNFELNCRGNKKQQASITLATPGIHQVMNALAAIAACMPLIKTSRLLDKHLKAYTGIKRRFEYHFRSATHAYIDDYAHHPTEIRFIAESLREIYPQQKIMAIFQPHLFSRTRDFAAAFGESLSLFDEVVLLPIYPAREKPITGVNEKNILQYIKKSANLAPSNRALMKRIKASACQVFISLGAGDIGLKTNIIKAQIAEKAVAE